MAETKRSGNGGDRAALLARLKDLQSLQAEAGWFSTSKYPDGGPPVAYVAVIHEFGYPEGGIPSRSFVRVAKEKYQPGWAVLMGKGAAQVMKGKMSARNMYDALGLQVAGDIRHTLATTSFEKLKDSTIAARARKRKVSVEAVNRDPLHDTGYMQASLTNQTKART